MEIAFHQRFSAVLTIDFGRAGILLPESGDGNWLEYSRLKLLLNPTDFTGLDALLTVSGEGSLGFEHSVTVAAVVNRFEPIRGAQVTILDGFIHLTFR